MGRRNTHRLVLCLPCMRFSRRVWLRVGLLYFIGGDYNTAWQTRLVREHKERRISLTTTQGKFFYHLPFPNAKPLTIVAIMEKAGIGLEYTSEVQDIVDELIQLGVIKVL